MLERIQIETLRLMNEKGMNFTVAELATQLAVSKRCIYERFASKTDLVVSVLDEILADLQLQVRKIVRSRQMETIDKLKALMTMSPKALGPLSSRLIADVKRLLPEQWISFEIFFDDRWQEIQNLVEQGVQQGLFRPVDLTILQQIYRGAINELIEYQYLTRCNQTFHNAIVAATDMLIYGVISHEKRQIEQGC
ncbi:TetR/AcrR family transcriptional regulator [Malonomonas rubra]|uniref:TetR/AcrR family transcriptional regulator n=1 Tax=Malonomonas rubra TaxID=57040 RepID=UPI0026F35DAE|nr:TetR/AcrR family transcriptional regulator [Malonomonas rubra]